MAFGTRICACCGSKKEIEEHHLYLKSHGCPDDLTVYLCSECHGRTHKMKRRIDISEATKQGLARAKARGVKLGNPQGAVHLRRYEAVHGHKAAIRGRVRKADEFAEKHRVFMQKHRVDWQWSSRNIASYLNVKGIPTRRGGRWSSTAVMRVVKRLNMI